MNTNTTGNPARRVVARFDAETHFDLMPRFESPSREPTERTFERLKARLLKPVLQDAPDRATERQLRLAANEAAAVAWTTSFPLLVLPILLEEKAAEVHRYSVRQERVQEVSPVLVADTA